MNEKSTPSTSTQLNSQRHGSSLTSYSDPLDRERAASMADEGGASGAMIDAIEQAAPERQRRRAGSLAKWIGVVAIGAAVALCARMVQAARGRATRSRTPLLMRAPAWARARAPRRA